MNKKHLIGVAAVATGIAAAITPAATAAAADPPEAHILLIGTDSAQATWNTHGRTGCSATVTEGTQVESVPNIPPTGSGGIIKVTQNATLKITCPGGVTSATARLYGPRNPFNDIRTNFNDSTGDAFGS
ncbi:hypothetical protein [Gordonia polyisoprenivorans]|uniref:hypothetical protein n=1 Tax=Gordonia polyisoprenivorans TaxID=84595 RepID=UPI00036B9EC1|nr:hypothetical protein [Gordonia polyisoprenivorans]